MKKVVTMEPNPLYPQCSDREFIPLEGYAFQFTEEELKRAADYIWDGGYIIHDWAMTLIPPLGDYMKEHSELYKIEGRNVGCICYSIPDSSEKNTCLLELSVVEEGSLSVDSHNYRTILP